jgi:hypothetical protein
MTRLSLVILSFGLVHCASAPAPRPASPASESPQSEPPAEAPAPSSALPDFVKGTPNPPERCREWETILKAVAALPESERRSCAAAPIEILDDALAEPDDQQRFRKLAASEACQPFSPGLAHALAVEVAPAECRDALVGDYLSEHAQALNPALRDALVGLALEARLSRLVTEIPKLDPPFDKSKFLRHFRETLAPWILEQAVAVNRISEQGASLHGYGKAVAAVAAGVTDMRFVSLAREIPLPEEMTKDPEIQDAYYGALDQALEPRKERGRDAALVGLGSFASLGILHDARTTEARKLLSTLYSGHPIDALDRLLLPAPPVFSPTTAAERVARTLNPFYSGFAFSASAPDERSVLGMAEVGLSPAVTSQLEKSGVTPATRAALLRFWFEIGRRYWIAEAFQRVLTLAEHAAKPGELSDEEQLVVALSRALALGPKNAAEMMLKGPLLPAGISNVRALDTLSTSKGKLAGSAAFDAAYLLELVPAEKSATDWTEVATRYERAKGLLKDAEAAKEAGARAAAARQTGRAVTPR